jgi:hypothetical protein
MKGKSDQGCCASSHANTSAVSPSARASYVVLLERPINAETLTSAVVSSLRARRRQYQARQHLLERERAHPASAQRHGAPTPRWPAGVAPAHAPAPADAAGPGIGGGVHAGTMRNNPGRTSPSSCWRRAKPAVEPRARRNCCGGSATWFCWNPRSQERFRPPRAAPSTTPRRSRRPWRECPIGPAPPRSPRHRARVVSGSGRAPRWMTSSAVPGLTRPLQHLDPAAIGRQTGW